MPPEISLFRLFPTYKSPTLKLTILFLSTSNNTTSNMHPEDWIAAFSFPVNCTKKLPFFSKPTPLFSVKKIIKCKSVCVKYVSVFLCLGSLLSGTQCPGMVGRGDATHTNMVYGPWPMDHLVPPLPAKNVSPHQLHFEQNFLFSISFF